MQKSQNAAQIAIAMQAQILQGEFPPDKRLPSERALAQTHGVARETIRSALRKLQRNGLVAIRPGSGCYINYTTRSNGPLVRVENTRPLELIDARMALEPHICRLMVLNANENELTVIDDIIDEMEMRADDPVFFSNRDSEFHFALARATRNPLLIDMSIKINDVRAHKQWHKMRDATLTPKIIRTYCAQHRKIMAFVHARNAEGAAQAMRQHLETARQSLVKAMEP